MNGSTAVLTGATSGIGEAAARLFATTAGRLIVHGPESRDGVVPLMATVSTAGNAELHYVQDDFDDLDQVVALAARVRGLTDTVDVLVNNAGRPGAERCTLSRNGYEATLQTNYLAAFLLTHHLAPVLPSGGRVVHVASATHLFAVRGAAPEHGARNVVDAATRPLPSSGAYIDDGRPADPSAQVQDPGFRRRLHRVTSRFLAAWT